MGAMKNVDYTILSISKGEKRSTALLQAGACVAMASYSRGAFEQNVTKWIESIGLTLPAIVKAPRGRPSAKGAKVVKLPTKVSKRAERTVRGAGTITRDDKGSVRIALTPARQSELANTLVRGVVAWYSAQQQRDYSPCVVIKYGHKPMIVSKASVLKDFNLDRQQVRTIAVAVSRMYGMLRRMGIEVTIEGQTQRTTKGGRKPSAKAASEKDASLRMVNAMAPREAYAYCVKHGMSEKALVKLAQYIVNNIADAA